MISELPLFLFTLLGGTAAGIYACSAIFPKALQGKKNLIVPTIALVLLAVGGVALLFHLGRPERMLKAFRNLSAGITQEAYATMAFGIVVFIDLVLCSAKKSVPQALRCVGAVLAVILVVVMANAYFAIVTNQAMHSWQTFAQFLFAAAALGMAFVAALHAGGDDCMKLAKIACVVAVVFAATILLEGVHYMGAGLGFAAFAISAVIAAAGAACAWVAQQKGATLLWVAFALVFIAAAVSRYAFYLAIG